MITVRSKSIIVCRKHHTSVDEFVTSVRASIILVSYNGIEYLQPCIDSIHYEITSEDEIILVDNASTDASVRLVQAHFSQVRLICNDTNRGFAVACNQGAYIARGDTLIFLNQDTRVQPGWLVGLLAALEQDHGIGLATSKLLLMSQPERIHMCGQDIHFTGLAFGRGFLTKSEGFTHARKVGAVSGASFAISKELWQKLGGFDPELYMYYEETDLCWRARLAGYSSTYCPDSVAYHDYSLVGSPQAHAYSERNRQVLLLKNWKLVTLFLLLPSLLLAEIIDWGYMAMLGWKGIHTKFTSWIWLIRNFPAVVRARGDVQSTRKEPDWILLSSCTSQLTPRLHTGGLIGRLIISICNLWFAFHYQAAFILMRNLNI